jgi:hypothetical protein
MFTTGFFDPIFFKTATANVLIYFVVFQTFKIIKDADLSLN